MSSPHPMPDHDGVGEAVWKADSVYLNHRAPAFVPGSQVEFRVPIGNGIRPSNQQLLICESTS